MASSSLSTTTYLRFHATAVRDSDMMNFIAVYHYVRKSLQCNIGTVDWGNVETPAFTLAGVLLNDTYCCMDWLQFLSMMSFCTPSMSAFAGLSDAIRSEAISVIVGRSLYLQVMTVISW